MMARRATVLYRIDDRGDIVAVNYHEPTVAPLVRVGRDLQGDVIWFNALAEPAFREQAEAIIATARPWTGVMAPSGLGPALFEGLHADAGALALYEGLAAEFPAPAGWNLTAMSRIRSTLRRSSTSIASNAIAMESSRHSR